MNKKRRTNLHKLALAVQKAIEHEKQDGICVYNNNMEHMQLNGKPFGEMTWHSEGEYSSSMDTYKWCPPTGYTVKCLGSERHSQCSYFYVYGLGNEYIVTDNADYSPEDVSDQLQFMEFEDVPHFILTRLGR